MFVGSAKKDKEKKKESREARDQSVEAAKKKDKKEKPKLKLIQKSRGDSESSTSAAAAAAASAATDGESEGAAAATSNAATSGSGGGHVSPDEAKPLFGVPLSMAVERDRSHDGVPLPALVRRCIDHLEENGLMQEGIYRSSGVKSKVNKLKTGLDARKRVNLHDYEPNVVASVFKQYLRELPEPVLTLELMPRFERVSADPSPQVKYFSVIAYDYMTNLSSH